MLSLPFEPSNVGEAGPPQRQTFPNTSVPLSFRKDFTMLSHWTPMNMCPVVRAGTHPPPPNPSPKLVSTSQAQACFHLTSQASSVMDSHPLGDQGTNRDPWIPMGAFKLRLTQRSGRVVRK